MPKKRTSPFIVLEAINAGGKTTQFNLLLQRLKKSGYKVKSYHFHQRDFPTGQLIENKFLHQQSNTPPLRGGDSSALRSLWRRTGGGDRRSKQHNPFTRREQALLYIQDFFTRQLEINKFLSAPASKNIVLADRFYTSTMAYQTIGLKDPARRKMLAWIKWLCLEGEPSLPQPSLVILLDTPVEISTKHLQKTKLDYFENRQRLQAIRRSYLSLADEEKWIVISSVNDRGEQRSIEDIHTEIWSKVTKLL